MRDHVYVSGLLDLHNLKDANERRATWRQSMATLARASTDDGPGPLDGLHPDALVRGVKAAIANGLVDDLDFLAPSAAGAALYELASALPIGPEQRDLGRRVLARLLEGNAEGFVALATRMAQSTGKGLGSPAVHARVALAMEMPLGVGIQDGKLALALASRRELAREWVGLPSTGSLPSRRLTARLLERAAREAARRASQGDAHALRAFAADTVSGAWSRLLADRESLVWRHVAIARGLIAPWVPEMKRQIEGAFAADLSPTEWRRGATSVAALVAVSPDVALRILNLAIAQGAMERDIGVGTSILWGLARAMESEPDAAEEMLGIVLERLPADVAEAVLEMQQEYGPAEFVDKAAQRALDALAKVQTNKDDDGAEALTKEISRDLMRQPRDDQPLREQLARALNTYATDGARAAYLAARELVGVVTGEMDALAAVAKEDDEAEGRAGSLARRTSLSVLRDLDMSILERSVLSDLLKLGPAENARAHEEALDVTRERLGEWLLTREAPPLGDGRRSNEQVRPSHPSLRLRRLRALLHLVDGDEGDGDDQVRAARLRQRWQTIAKALLHRFEREPRSMLRRTVVAALARALDALVRTGTCDVADALLVVARQMADPVDFETLAEASMDPDLVHVLSRYAIFLRTASKPIEIVGSPGDSIPPPSSQIKRPDPLLAKLDALEELARELSPDASGRIEALRSVLSRLHGALKAVSSAVALRSLASSGGTEADAITQLEAALGALSVLASGARARLDPNMRDESPAASMSMGRPLTVAVSRVLSGSAATLTETVISACLDELLVGIPAALARVSSGVVWGLADLPFDRTSIPEPPSQLAEQQLPAWLPARRTIGGFYVQRALGAGGVGSVFIVTRVEDRHDENAERFALKVPDYSANAARSLSEAEFLQMFRSEASALMSIPSHTNLARFVTFDVGARPKPILVMELVEGVTLERVIESRALDTARTLDLLDEVLAGLEAMHGAGVGHLDLKPSNVVLRAGKEPVLVDFGLAGRHVRPGCATGPYGAPEVWGAIPDGVTPTPMMADVYAFGCIAFEALTGQVLFDAPNELAQISLHIAHDGFPPPLRALSQKSEYQALAELLFTTLRRDGRVRPTVTALRTELRRLAKQMTNIPWPLVA